MIAAAAITLIQVALRHKYFGGGFADYTVRARPGTDRVCASLGLRLLQNGSQLSLVIVGSSVDRISSSNYSNRLAAQSLCWEIVPSGQSFPAYTGLDYSASDSVLILSSTPADAAGGRLTQATLASSLDVRRRQASRFVFTPERPLRVGSNVLLQTSDGTTIRELTITDPNRIAVDTTNSGAGLYQLVQGRVTLARWFADASPSVNAIAGPVLVLSGPLLAAVLAAVTSRNPVGAPPVFTAEFPNRAVVWRYHVFNTGGHRDLAVKPLTSYQPPSRSPGRKAKPGAAAPTTFRKIEKTLFPAAVSFEAVDPMPLTADVKQRFSLRDGDTAVYTPLPLVGFNFARPAAGAEIYSDIFVYLPPETQSSPSS
jgi:hypothetical protein